MTVTAVERCLTLLEELAGEAEPVELVELAERIGLPNSATHRILSTLLKRGWVTQDKASQKYALSLRLSTLAFRNLDARAVPDVVQIAMDDLAARTREYCRLAIVEGEDLVWVARAQGATAGLRYDPDMGQELVLHATANGKAWLATLPEREALKIVRHRGLTAARPLGPRAVTDIDDLRRHLDETRARGFATSIEEGEQGAIALAVPFYDGSDGNASVAGTVSVAGPVQRFAPERFETLAADLRDAAEQLSSMWPLRARQRDVLRRRASHEAGSSSVKA